MADGHGGKRTPTNPAPVSGPGKMSRRTDGKQPAMYMSGGSYGEGQDLMDLQTSAPMEQAPSVPQARPTQSSSAARQQPAQVSPLFGPTERPDQPLTHGAPFGPGPGPAPEANPGASVADSIAKFLPYDVDGTVAQLYQMALAQGW